MSWENTECPCGGKKQSEKMICARCEAMVAGTFDRQCMDDRVVPLEQRRAAAIRVLAASRRQANDKFRDTAGT